MTKVPTVIPRRLEKITAMTSIPSIAPPKRIARPLPIPRYHAAKQCTEQQIRAGKRRGNTDINRKDIRDQPCEKRVDRHRIDRIGSKKPAQFFQTDRNRGIFNNKRKKDRDRYGGVICSSNMEVPEIPLSYNLTGVRKIVIPKAFMIPATVSISRFTTRKFLGFCTPLFRWGQRAGMTAAAR